MWPIIASFVTIQHFSKFLDINNNSTLSKKDKSEEVSDDISPEQSSEGIDNTIDLSYLGTNVKDIRKASVTSESELPFTSSSDSETDSALKKGNMSKMIGFIVWEICFKLDI